MRNTRYDINNLLALSNNSPEAHKLTEQFINENGGIQNLNDTKGWAEISREFSKVLLSTKPKEDIR